LEVDIHPAAEYLMDENFESLLEEKKPLLTLSGNLVLVEFSFVSPPMKVQDILFNMQINGYQPVLAHPERYAYLQRNKEFYDELKQAGCLFQLNMLSLTNYYGKGASELAEYLLGRDYYDLAGTDLHHDRHLAGFINYGMAIKTILRLIDSGRLLNPTW
jgi:tyrosine-protein phosphatase YwqE